MKHLEGATLLRDEKRPARFKRYILNVHAKFLTYSVLVNFGELHPRGKRNAAQRIIRFAHALFPEAGGRRFGILRAARETLLLCDSFATRVYPSRFYRVE